MTPFPSAGQIWRDTAAKRFVLVVESDENGVQVFDPETRAFRNIPMEEFLGSHESTPSLQIPIAPAIIVTMAVIREVRPASSIISMLTDLTTAISRFLTDPTRRSQNLCIIAAYAAAYAATWAEAVVGEGDPNGPKVAEHPKIVENILLVACPATFLINKIDKRSSLCDENLEESARAGVLITDLMNVTGLLAARKGEYERDVRDALTQMAVDAMAWVAHNLNAGLPGGEDLDDILQ